VCARPRPPLYRTADARTPQEPLYVPAGAELLVSLWRQTGARRVWYEWAAEVFLPLPAGPSPGASPSRRGSLAPGAGSSPSRSPASLLSPSPSAYTDAPDAWPTPGADGAHAAEGPPVRMVKVGMTGLHNPGGRSSWIGL
jgi:protein arginine N-methyltransferase 5